MKKETQTPAHRAFASFTRDKSSSTLKSTENTQCISMWSERI